MNVLEWHKPPKNTIKSIANIFFVLLFYLQNDVTSCRWRQMLLLQKTKKDVLNMCDK